MLRPATLGCGAGPCGCSCGGQGFGAAAGQGHTRRYPKIESVLRAYVAQQQASNQYYYIGPGINSSTPTSTGFGDGVSASWTPDPTTIVADPISNAASSIGDFFSSLWGSTPPAGFTTTQDANGVTGSWTPAVPAGAIQGSPVASLPSAIQPQVTAAAAQDLFGFPVSGWIIGGAAAFLLLALVTAPRSRRRRAA